MKHDARFVWLDLVRGASALAVCAGHIRAAMFVDYTDVESATLFQKLFYFVTGLGHQAVLIFFVLSGFFVGGSILRNQQNFIWVDYWVARLSRLWVVLIPALIFTFIVDQFIAARTPLVLGGANYAIWSSGPPADGTFSNSMMTFLGNIAFLQTIYIPVFGTNAPLWSLANEFWYYVLFPFTVYALGHCYKVNKPSVIARLIYGVAALALFFLITPGIRLGFFIWLLGVLVYFALNRWDRFSLSLVVVSGIGFVSSLAYSKSNALQTVMAIEPDWVVGFGFALFCFSIANLAPPRILTTWFISVARGLSEISYSLYLIHFPLVILIGAWFYTPTQLTPNLSGFVYFIAYLVFLVLAGTGFWWIFERQTHMVRKFILKQIRSRK